jgi:hypothetical protein
MKVSDRVPHLEYFSMPRFKHFYKRVGGELVICDRSEYRVNSLHVRLPRITVMEVVADQWVGYLHRSDCAVAELEELEVEVEQKGRRTLIKKR